jgi:hypothetical protein
VHCIESRARIRAGILRIVNMRAAGNVLRVAPWQCEPRPLAAEVTDRKLGFPTGVCAEGYAEA